MGERLPDSEVKGAVVLSLTLDMLDDSEKSDEDIVDFILENKVSLRELVEVFFVARTFISPAASPAGPHRHDAA